LPIPIHEAHSGAIAMRQDYGLFLVFRGARFGTADCKCVDPSFL
jgi:hypothetical protein